MRNSPGAAPGHADFNNVLDRLALNQGKRTFEAHLHWNEAIDYDFSERLWLMGAMSDNVAATSCLSEIGVAYVKAVQRAYGLFDEPKGMHLLLAGPYSLESTDDGRRQQHQAHLSAAAGTSRCTASRMRSSTPATKKFDDQSSWEPGSAAALTAYMIAFVQQAAGRLRPWIGRGRGRLRADQENLSHGVAGDRRSATSPSA